MSPTTPTGRGGFRPFHRAAPGEAGIGKPVPCGNRFFCRGRPAGRPFPQVDRTNRKSLDRAFWLEDKWSSDNGSAMSERGNTLVLRGSAVDPRLRIGRGRRADQRNQGRHSELVKRRRLAPWVRTAGRRLYDPLTVAIFARDFVAQREHGFCGGSGSWQGRKSSTHRRIATGSRDRIPPGPRLHSRFRHSFWPTSMCRYPGPIRSGT